MNFVNDIKNTFKSGGNLTKLIYINIGFFLFSIILNILFFLFKQPGSQTLFLDWLALPADLSKLLVRPWTMFSYMFLQLDFLHILFNLLWLYSFGKLFLFYLDEKKLLSVYLLGGLSGAFLYLLTYNLFPVFEPARDISVALGASAAVMAVVVAISTYAPNHIVYVPFFGKVKIKYFAIIFIALDLLFIYNRSSNLGGHIAHLGGALFGFYYIYRMRKGIDIAKGFDRLLNSFLSIFNKRPKMKVSYKKPETDMEYNARKSNEQKEINKILDKIAKSGYDSLTTKEKEQLFRMSSKK